MSTLGLYFEDKPLRQGTKRALGPADRYPQDQFQKEDELSATFLKHGFSLINPLVSQPNESSSAKDVFTQKFTEKSEEDETLMPNFYEKRVLKSLKQIQDDSLRCSQIQDDLKNEKKKVSIPKESFRILQPGIAAHQNRHRDLKIFLEDLSDSIPLEDLLNPKKRNTKIPMFLPRKSELFYLFGEHNVPVARATWYIKLIAYNMPLLMPEATSKSTRTKRQNNDPTAEWTKKVVDFFEEMWNKQTDMNLPTQKPQSNNQAKPMSREAIEDYWNYANDLMRYMYTENMLDKEEVLQRLLKICESIKAGEEFKLRQILSTILVYISDFVRNTLHSRRLAFFVSQMIYWIEVEVPEEISQSREKSEALVPSSTKEKMNNNPEYERRFDTLTWGLNSIIHLITMYCPSALVWYEPADIRNHPGSPLDILPQAPSQMLIPPSAAQFYNGEQEYLQYLRQHERMISKRSTAVENKWSRYTSKDSLTSAVISKVVDIIRILDKAAQAIRNADPNKADPLKPVYDAIFKLGNIETSSIIGTLCDWAVNSKRYGNFRAILIAKLLAQRQEEIDAQEPGRKTSVPVFQTELFMYLHESAPYSEKTEAFHHLICLFGELIRHDCFSHSMYISSLISRGIRTDISSHSNPGKRSTNFIF